MNEAQLAEFKKAISAALAANPAVAEYAGTNSTDSILNAYTTGDWSNVVSLSGVPFTKEQQTEAVTQAEKALNPAYEAQRTYDTAGVSDSLEQEQQGYDQFRKTEAEDFGNAKDTQDLNAADQGILFSGARVQKLRDLRNTYQDRDAIQRGRTASNIQTTARDYQYKYGDQGARSIKSMYNLGGPSTFNANVAGGKVNQNTGLSSVYNTRDYNFQGTAPVSQQASVQTRAASLLSNRANKLTSTGFKNKF